MDVGKKGTMSFVIVRTVFFQVTDLKIPRRPREVQPFLMRDGAGGWFLAFQEISSKEGTKLSNDLFPSFKTFKNRKCYPKKNNFDLFKSKI